MTASVSIAFRVGLRLGVRALLRRSRLSLTVGSAIGVVGLTSALAVTAVGRTSIACSAGDYACSGQRMSMLFAVIAIPVLAVIAIVTRTSLARRIPPYVRLHAIGARRLHVIVIAVTEAMVVALPGAALGMLVGVLALAWLPLDIDGQVAISCGVAATLITLGIEGVSTVLSLPLRESRALSAVRTSREAIGQIVSVLWVVATGTLILLATINGNKDAYSSSRAGLWLLASVVAVLSLPAVLVTTVALTGRALRPLVDPVVSLRMASRQMQWQPGSLARAGQVLATGVAVAVAAQFMWIAFAATPSVDRVIVAQDSGPNVLVFTTDTPTDSGPVSPSDSYLTAPLLHGNCEDGSCGVLVLPCGLIGAVLNTPTPACPAASVYAVAPGASEIQGATVRFDSIADELYTISTDAIVGDGASLASFFSDFYVTAVVTPEAFTGPLSPLSQNWLVIAPPGETGDDVIASTEAANWTQIGGLSDESIAEVQGTQRQVLGVAWLALAASLVGLVALSFDNYAERSRMARQWERFGLPRRVGNLSFLLSQILASAVACLLGCVTGALIAWNLGYATVDSVRVGSRWQAISMTAALGLCIVLVNTGALVLGERLVRRSDLSARRPSLR